MWTYLSGFVSDMETVGQAGTENAAGFNMDIE